MVWAHRCCTSISVAIMGAVKLSETLCLVPRASVWDSLHRSPADGQFCARSTAPGQTPPSCQPRFSSCWWSERNGVVVYTRSCSGQPCAPRRESKSGSRCWTVDFNPFPSDLFHNRFSQFLHKLSSVLPQISRLILILLLNTHTHTPDDSNLVRHIVKTAWYNFVPF